MANKKRVRVVEVTPRQAHFLSRLGSATRTSIYFGRVRNRLVVSEEYNPEGCLSQKEVLQEVQNDRRALVELGFVKSNSNPKSAKYWRSHEGEKAMRRHFLHQLMVEIAAVASSRHSGNRRISFQSLVGSCIGITAKINIHTLDELAFRKSLSRLLKAMEQKGMVRSFGHGGWEPIAPKEAFRQQQSKNYLVFGQKVSSWDEVFRSVLTLAEGRRDDVDFVARSFVCFYAWFNFELEGGPINKDVVLKFKTVPEPDSYLLEDYRRLELVREEVRKWVARTKPAQTRAAM